MSDQGSQIIKDVLAKMTDKLDEDQLTLLEANMIVALHGVRIEKESTELAPLQRDWEWYLKRLQVTQNLKPHKFTSICNALQLELHMKNAINNPRKE